MKETAVKLVDVTKRFAEVVAVDDVSLTIEDGEFFSLLGTLGDATEIYSRMWTEIKTE